MTKVKKADFVCGLESTSPWRSRAMNVQRLFLAVFFLASPWNVGLVASELSGHNVVKVDLRRLKVPVKQDRVLLGNWLLDLKSTTMEADRLGVDVSGEKYVVAKVDGRERVIARRFAFTWVIDNKDDRERLVFGDQSLLGSAPELKKSSHAVYSQASAYDQLRLKRWFYGATGKQVHKASMTKTLNARFRLCGVFYPICGVTGSVVSISTGRAFDRAGCQLHARNLIGVYRVDDLVIAAFEYHPAPDLIYLRTAVFRSAVPVQVDDFVSLGRDLLHVAELGQKRGPEELSLIHKVVKPYARTVSSWRKVGGMHLPFSLHSLTLGGDKVFEVKAYFEWKIGQQIPDSVFAVEGLGRTSPLALWQHSR